MRGLISPSQVGIGLMGLKCPATPQKGLKANTEMFYGNGYDSPMKPWWRRNEVWKIKI